LYPVRFGVALPAANPVLRVAIVVHGMVGLIAR
jgi:hypothetical protein